MHVYVWHGDSRKARIEIGRVLRSLRNSTWVMAGRLGWIAPNQPFRSFYISCLVKTECFHPLRALLLPLTGRRAQSGKSRSMYISSIESSYVEQNLFREMSFQERLKSFSTIERQNRENDVLNQYEVRV